MPSIENYMRSEKIQRTSATRDVKYLKYVLDTFHIFCIYFFVNIGRKAYKVFHNALSDSIPNMPSIENYMRSEFYMNSLLMSQIELEENPKNISNTQLLDCENKLTIMEHENNKFLETKNVLKTLVKNVLYFT
jgi:hypothetical protein